jgi:predicted transcriptional regulator
MANSTDRCTRLRKLRARIVEEINTLKEDMREEEREGVGNPIEMARVLKSLQETLTTILLELQKCPPED